MVSSTFLFGRRFTSVLLLVLLHVSDPFTSHSLLAHRLLPKTHPNTSSLPQTTSRHTDRRHTELNGIPKMFRWLTDQYPTINKRLSEGLGPEGGNQRKIDNFYLDMNGIIHPATHNNQKSSIVILDETAMFKRIFSYVDVLFKIVRPTNVLYLAVDGVAPRAKMNQQRGRRFRSGKESEDIMAHMVAQGKSIPADSEKFDSNCITPGTDFMLKLSLATNRWIEYKMKTDPAWKDSNIKVIFSGPDVPGEGEHKVMDYIREQQKIDPERTNDLTHVLYGLDADLIMLGLVTHSKHFLLLREKMSVVMAGKKGSRNNNRGRKPRDMLQYDRRDFELLDLSYLRDMLRAQFSSLAGKKNLKFAFDMERIIDDFVFMCMIVGNDFIPNMPHMAIDGGALNTMITAYTDLLPVMGGYLTNKNRINPRRFEMFLTVIRSYESEYFQRRGVEEDEPDFCDSDKYKAKYYSDKLKLLPTASDAKEQRRAIARDYIEGLHWCLQYYHKGCRSWSWYYPHLYAPLSTDLVDLSSFYEADLVDDEGFGEFSIPEGKPFTSLTQLLSVLPPSSQQLLPKPYAALMQDNSELSDYYPREFTTDQNGKRQSWEAVINIPFIDENRMFKAVENIDEEQLSESERRRNTVGVVREYEYKQSREQTASN